MQETKNRIEEYKQFIDYEKGILNPGNTCRLKAVMERAMKGEPVTVAFLGGSITQGSVASTSEGCYAYLTYQWWREHFPKAEITYVNAGIGGTTSHLGVGRVEEEVLSHRPDFCIVEFSVNDADTDAHFQETYESLVRRILQSETAPALMTVHNVRYDDGGNAEAIHVPVVKHYNLPSVAMRPTIYAQVEAGRIIKRDITPDDLHPNDVGHALVASVIIFYLNRVRTQVKNELAEGIKAGARAQKGDAFWQLPAPLTQSAYEQAHRFRNDELKPVVCEGFTADMTSQSCVADCFKKGYAASQKGARIVFSFEGSNLGVQYRKTVRRPAPVATLILDGDAEHPITLDANFDEEWGDCLYLETVMEHGNPGSHMVDIEITAAGSGDKETFYLVSLITA